MVGKTNSQHLTDVTAINHSQIGEYFKILNCCEEMREVFERYSGTKLDSYLQYLAPLLTRENFRQFLIF